MFYLRGDGDFDFGWNSVGFRQDTQANEELAFTVCTVCFKSYMTGFFYNCRELDVSLKKTTPDIMFAQEIVKL